MEALRVVAGRGRSVMFGCIGIMRALNRDKAALGGQQRATLYRVIS